MIIVVAYLMVVLCSCNTCNRLVDYKQQNVNELDLVSVSVVIVVVLTSPSITGP